MPDWPELALDREVFLARHWQREPVLLRGALPGFEPPLGADELAGLAMEEDVESRIVACENGRWTLRHGPFDLAALQREGAWTLLVQAVDQHVPTVARLLSLIDFIPSWRVDDVMVSYGGDGASVGPHFDNYDVFLLQATGSKHWRLGQFCDRDTPLLPHPELRILQSFDERVEYLLEPGDMLYVPPGVAHWGICRGDSVTYSIGFRAPRINALVSRWVDRLLETLDPELFYCDPGLEGALRPGEIRPRDLERAERQLQAALDQLQDNHWFGEVVTEPRYDTSPDTQAFAEALAVLASGPVCVRLSPGARLAWQHEPGLLTVYANGDSLGCDEALLPAVEALCGTGELAGATLARLQGLPGAGALLRYLLENGCIDVD